MQRACRGPVETAATGVKVADLTAKPVGVRVEIPWLRRAALSSLRSARRRRVKERFAIATTLTLPFRTR